MPAITAPYVETQPVVTGIMYQITLREEYNGTGITKMAVGPYYFTGSGQNYPEPVTNELSPPGFSPIGWTTDSDGASWLVYDGGPLLPEDGEVVFRFTSNFPATTNGPARLAVWRGTRSETFDVPVPDYSQPPQRRNTRHDSTGLGRVYRQFGCFPQLVVGALALTLLATFLWLL